MEEELEFENETDEMPFGHSVSNFSFAFSYGYLPLCIVITLIVDVSVMIHLHRLSPARVPKPVAGAIFLLQLSTVLDLLNLLAPLTQWIYTFTKPNVVSCKVLQFFAREPYTIGTWCCAVFMMERASQRLMDGDYRKYFTPIRLKLGFALFALVLGAAYTNYMWMYSINPEMQHCLINIEFGEAYYNYIVFAEPVIEFVLPQLMTLIGLCAVIVTIVKESGRTTPVEELNLAVWNNCLNCCGIALSLSNVIMEAPKNITRFVSVITERQVLFGFLHLFYIIAESRIPLRGCLILLFLKLNHRRLRRNNLSTNTDFGVQV